MTQNDKLNETIECENHTKKIIWYENTYNNRVSFSGKHIIYMQDGQHKNFLSSFVHESSCWGNTKENICVSGEYEGLDMESCSYFCLYDDFMDSMGTVPEKISTKEKLFKDFLFWLDIQLGNKPNELHEGLQITHQKELIFCLNPDYTNELFAESIKKKVALLLDDVAKIKSYDCTEHRAFKSILKDIECIEAKGFHSDDSNLLSKIIKISNAREIQNDAE